MTITADTPVRALPGAGPMRAKQLEEAGLATAGDLIYYLPYRYEDRRHPVRIADVGRHTDTPILLRGKVMSANMHTTRLKRMKVFEVVLEDGTGAVKLVWFNQGFLGEQIRRGDRLAVFGTPKISSYGQLQIESADWEKFEGDDEADGAIVPIYSKVGNIPPKALRQIIGGALNALPTLDDPLSPVLRKRLGVIDLAPALEQIHRPPQLEGRQARDGHLGGVGRGGRRSSLRPLAPPAADDVDRLVARDAQQPSLDPGLGRVTQACDGAHRGDEHLLGDVFDQLAIIYPSHHIAADQAVIAVEEPVPAGGLTAARGFDRAAARERSPRQGDGYLAHRRLGPNLSALATNAGPSHRRPDDPGCGGHQCRALEEGRGDVRPHIAPLL